MDFEVRKVRKAQGPERLQREREEYFRLMQLGYSNKEACQVVGINLRTGRAWRNGRTSPNRTVAPALSPRTPRSTSSRYLREDERIHIADRLQEKTPIRAIAAELGRSPSTISREIRRNRRKFPDRSEMHVTHETVYQALYVQGRGEAPSRTCQGPADRTRPLSLVGRYSHDYY